MCPEALYELQVNETKACLESFRGSQSDMGEMLEHVSLGLTVRSSSVRESQQLAIMWLLLIPFTETC